MGCSFCATGQMGFIRHLTSGEITAQVLYFVRHLRQQDKSLSNIVIMGMGEPFHNYDNTMAAIERLSDPRGLQFGARRFTVSTAGIIPKIIQFTHERRQVNLAISLHAADDVTRAKLLPIAKSYPLERLLDACKTYVDVTGRRITFEWAMIKEVNDSAKDAHLLVNLLRGLVCHVNIIPLNPTIKYAGKPTTSKQAKLFQEELGKYGIPCTIRLRRGIDIQAGCGQLATQVSGNPG